MQFKVEENIDFYLREIAELWLFVVIGLLSFIIFGFGGFIGSSQILEIYRVFALNPGTEASLWNIIYSIISVFMLSILIIDSYASYGAFVLKNSKPEGASQFILKGSETLGISLLWVMILRKWDAPKRKEIIKKIEIHKQLILPISLAPLLGLLFGFWSLLSESDTFYVGLIIIIFIVILIIFFLYLSIVVFKYPDKLDQSNLRVVIRIFFLVLFFMSSPKLKSFTLLVFLVYFISNIFVEEEYFPNLPKYLRDKIEKFNTQIEKCLTLFWSLILSFFVFGLNFNPLPNSPILDNLILFLFLFVGLLAYISVFDFLSQISRGSGDLDHQPPQNNNKKETETSVIQSLFKSLFSLVVLFVVFGVFVGLKNLNATLFPTNLVSVAITVIFLSGLFALVIYRYLSSQKNNNIQYDAVFWSVGLLVIFFVAQILRETDNSFNTLLISEGKSIILIAEFLFVLFALVFSIYRLGYERNVRSIVFSVIILPVLLAFIFSFIDLNDNHQITLIPPVKEAVEKEKTSLEESFTSWIEIRNEAIKTFAAKPQPYPIYIVSAQGGGIFAAYHSALTLSRLQDLCPAFANHTFAISAVSGGSLGATVFSSLVNVKPSLDTQYCSYPLQNEPPLEDDDKTLAGRAHQLLDRDFLSPTLNVGLFSDFFQRFIPFPVKNLDRARALEYAFEQGWKTEWSPKNPLKDSYYKHWSPEKTAPALVFNTTVVETGERLLLSPFKLNTSNSKFPVLEDIRSVACQPIDFPLSTAAVLSARFPLVTPVGWFSRCYDKNNDLKNGNPKGRKSRLADGGYFENSGFSTAFDIGQRLEKILEYKCEHKTFKDITCKYKASKDTTSKKDNAPRDNTFKIVYLAFTDNPPLKQDAGGLNELMSPLLAFYNSKEARGRSVIEQAEFQIDGELGSNKSSTKHRFRQFYLTYANPTNPVNPVDASLHTEVPKLPLGWYLSHSSQDAIKMRIGDPNACSEELKEEDADYPRYNNHCVMKSIIKELSL